MPPWKANRDPLFRGDARGGVSLPEPDADPSIVRHVLFLDGPGRSTPYLSTTESREVAERFAGRHGQVYTTRPPKWKKHGVGHLSRRELLQLLKGRGKGRASWPSAFEVLTARRRVEEHAEHLADFSGLPTEGLRALIDTLFPPRGHA